MFPSRPPEPLGAGIAPVMIYEESIEDQDFILNCIKTAHKQHVAEMRLHPRRRRVPKKKRGGHRVPRRVASVDAMDMDRDDIAIHRLSSAPRTAQSLNTFTLLPAVVPTRPCTPTRPRPVPDEDEDGDEQLLAAEFDRQYRATLEKAQQMQV
jgi:hypothetical protein